MASEIVGFRQTSIARRTDVRGTSDERPSDVPKTFVGRPTNVRGTSVGRPSDVRRTSDGRSWDVRRTSDGRPSAVGTGPKIKIQIFRILEGAGADYHAVRVAVFVHSIQFQLN